MLTVSIILKGLVTGLGLSLGLGTVFFALIQNSIKSGYKTGIAIASGVILSDVIFITFALLGTTLFAEGDLRSIWVQLVAISFLLFLGIYTWFHARKPVVKNPGPVPISVKSVLYFVVKGFLLNGFNPANFFAWTAIVTYTTGTMEYNLNQNILFFSFALVGIFLAECTISIGSHKIKNRLTDKFIIWMNHTVAVLYIVVAIALLINLLM